MKKITRKASAAALSAVMLSGAMLSFPSVVSMPVLTAEANAETVSFDPETGTLTLLAGDVKWADVHYAPDSTDVKHVVAEDGAVMPADCTCMFETSINVETVDLSNADFSKVETMSGMFSLCEHLTDVDLKGIDTSNVKDMRNMFYQCFSLPSVDLSGWDTSNVTNMDSMFESCILIKSVDMSGLDTSSVTNMRDLFRGCYELETVIMPMNTEKVTNMACMFYYCNALKTVMVTSGWSMENVEDTSSMFNDCKKIVGENGTVYDASIYDGQYARIDTADAPGYLTELPWSVNGVSMTLTDCLDLNFTGYVGKKVNKIDIDGPSVDVWVMPSSGGAGFKRSQVNRYSCPVYATDMDKEVKVQFLDRYSNPIEVNGKSSFTYSVSKYLENVKPEKDWSDEKKDSFDALISTVKNYGKISKAYFNTPGNMPFVNDYSEYYSSENYKPVKNANDKLSLSLESRLAIHFYPEGLALGSLASCDSETLVPRSGANDECYFEITGITPLSMAKYVTVKYNNSEYSFCPLSWCYLVKKNGLTGKNKVMADILYEYYRNAVSFANK